MMIKALAVIVWMAMGLLGMYFTNIDGVMNRNPALARKLVKIFHVRYCNWLMIAFCITIPAIAYLMMK